MRILIKKFNECRIFLTYAYRVAFSENNNFNICLTITIWEAGTGIAAPGK